jgi:hypothetical protein
MTTPLDEARDALRERDAKVALCPVNSRYFNSADRCPTCKATSAESCVLTGLADAAFVEATRTALAKLENPDV